MTGLVEPQRLSARVWTWLGVLPAALPRLACLVVTASLLAGCSSFAWFGGSKTPEVENTDPPDVIYGKAEQLTNKGKYGDAARAYEEVDINHPYSQEARKAILMASYAYYKAGKYDEAIGSADRYLTLHPGTQESDLAQDIIGMSYYDRVLDPKRDQTFARKALIAYDTLLQRYPEFALRGHGAQPDAHPARSVGRQRDDGRALLSPPQQLPCGDQPLPQRGHRLPNHRAGGRGLDAPDRGLYGVRHRQRGPNGGCRARP